MKKIKLFKAFLLVAICFSTGSIFAQVQKWAKTFNGSAGIADYGRAVTTDASGNVYVTGSANYLGDYHVVTIKYNSSGTAQWTTTVNAGSPTNCGVESGFAIAIDGSGNICVAANVVNGAGTLDQLALIKYNSSTGAVQTNYPKLYGGTNCSTVNGTAGLCIAISGSDVYVGGSAYIGTSWSFIILKDDPSSGNWGWSNTPYTYSGSNTAAEHRATDIKVSGSYVYATGYVANTSVGKDVLTVKLDASTGAIQTGWPKTYNGSANGDDFGNAIGIDASGYVYVAGFASITSNGKDGFLTKYKSDGTLQSGFPATYDYTHADDAWSDIAVIGTSTVAPAVYVGGYRTDGSNTNYSIAAYTSGGGFANGASYWNTADPVQYDGAKTGTEASGTDVGYAVEYSATTNRVYITGMTDEGSGTNNINLTTIGYNATTGAKVWGETKYDCTTDAIPNGIDEAYWKYALRVVYNSTYCIDDIYVVGASFVTSTLDFLTLKYSCGTCISCEGPEGEGRMINTHLISNENTHFHPNPFSTAAELRLNPNAQITNAVLSIFDITGRLVTSISNISSTTIIVDRGTLQSGLYFYNLSESGSMLTNGKFIIAD